MKEIINKEELINIIKETVNEVADTVCTTYGPNGKTVILTDNEGNGIVTKDGVSVCNSINFNNPYKNIITNIIKQVSQKTVEEVGDGTTTSICLTQAFINKGYELLDSGISYNEIKLALEELEKYVIKELKANSKKVKKKDIINIAKTASNNDIEVSKLINKAFKHSNIVKVEESILPQDSLITVNGMTLRTTYFDPAFINTSNQTIKYNECYIALIDGKMPTVDPIVNLVSKLDRQPLIIFADDFSDNVVKVLKQNYNNGSLDIALVKSPGVNTHRKNLINDISLYTNANILDPYKKYNELEYLGKLDGIEIKKEETILFSSKENKLVDIRIQELKELYKSDISKYDRELAKQRYESLEGKASIIKVGGNSPVEIKEKFDRYEDAIGSVKNALEEGFIEGGGLALKHIADNCLFTRSPILELTLCLYSCNNKLNRTIDNTIIDPTKVTICALQNAISVAKTILSTEAIVLNPNLWKQE